MRLKNSTLLGVFIVSFGSCIDPVAPEFDYIEDLVIIDGIASTIPGNTFVSIRTSYLDYGVYKSRFVSGSRVALINEASGTRLSLEESESQYVAPFDFVIQEASEWYIEATLPGGKTFKSTPEKAPISVSIQSIDYTYKKELEYDEIKNVYIPGHEVRIDFQDPQEIENYYYYQYRTFEPEAYCAICFDGVLRFGECVSVANNRRALDYYTYSCSVPCWKIRYNEGISIFDDTFTNGKDVKNLVVANVPLYGKSKVLVEVLQLNITESAHKYYKTVKDVVNNNSSLNAPLPSALIGNLYNADDSEEAVLGRFTVASGSTRSVSIARDQIFENIIRTTNLLQPELYGAPLPAPLTYDAPCEESRYRTAVQPLNWENE